MNKAKILVVDDQKSNIALLRAQLRDYEIISATEGRLALKLISESKPDLILLDVNMPGINGYAFLSIIKNANDTKDIPVILITGLSGKEERITAMKRGAIDLISKPFHPIELRTRVNSVLKAYMFKHEVEQIQRIAALYANANDMRANSGANHSYRTSEVAYEIAKKCTPNPDEQENIRIAALLHDIGKLQLPDSILERRQLTPEEMDIYKEHPVKSVSICKQLDNYETIIPHIRSHHEQYDGNGYPEGLKNMDIPLGARIIAIADCYARLTSAIGARPAMTPLEALQEIDKDAAIKYDPSIYIILEELIKSNKLSRI